MYSIGRFSATCFGNRVQKFKSWVSVSNLLSGTDVGFDSSHDLELFFFQKLGNRLCWIRHS